MRNCDDGDGGARIGVVRNDGGDGGAKSGAVRTDDGDGVRSDDVCEGCGGAKSGAVRSDDVCEGYGGGGRHSCV